MTVVTLAGLSNTLFQSLVMGLVFAALGLGFNIVYRVSKSINLAHPALALMAAYIAFVVSMRTGVLGGLIIASVSGFLVGIATEALVARPLRGRPPVALIAATLGVYYILKAVAMMVSGNNWQGGSLQLPYFRAHIGPLVVDTTDVLALAASGGLLVIVIAIHRLTRLGVAMRAAAEDAYGAAAYGLPVKRLTMLSWGLAGLAGGLAGVALAAKTGITPYIGNYALEALAASLLAGLDTIAGIVVGGLLLGLVRGLSGYMLNTTLPGIGDAAAFMLMLLVLLFKPYGLFGTERVERV